MTRGAKILPCLALAMMFVQQAQAAPREWDFTVTLDGQPIGQHVFTLFGEDTNRRIESKADFTVRLIGIPVYRYHHVAHEQWQKACLAQLTADTDHDGDITHVSASGSPEGGNGQMTEGENADQTKQISWNGCLMTFAYWNPALLKQTHLLNPESGEIEDVTISRQPDTTVTSNGKPIQASVWRITGSHNPVDVLYAPDGAWIGLDSTVKGGRILSYRLP